MWLLAPVLLSYFGFMPVQFCATNYNLAESRQDVPIAYARVNIPLGTILEELASRTGLKVQVSKAIKTRKATVLCSDKTPAEIVKALEETFALTSTVSGGTISFDLGVKARKAEAEHLRLRHSRVTASLVAWAKRMSELGIADAQTLASKGGEAYVRLQSRQGLSPAERKEIRRFLEDISSLSSLAISEVLFQSSELREALYAGKTLVFSTEEEPETIRIQKQLIPSLGNGTTRFPPKWGRARCWLDIQGGKLRIQSLHAYDMQTKVGSYDTSIDLISGSEATGPLYDFLAGWGVAEPFAALPPVALQKGKRLVSRPYRQSLASLGDILEYFHRGSGFNFVADGYRVGIASPTPLPISDLRQYLDSMRREAGSNKAVDGIAYAKLWKNNWCLIRTGTFLERHETELDEKLVSDLEQAVIGSPPIRLDTFTKFAQASEGGTHPFLDPSRESTTRFATKFVRDLGRGLALWGTFNDAQKRKCAGRGVPFRELTNRQRILFEEFLQDQLWSGGFDLITTEALIQHTQLTDSFAFSIEIDDMKPPFGDPNGGKDADPEWASPFEIGQRYCFCVKSGENTISRRMGWIDQKKAP